jgi:hypothetical protein
MIALAWAVAYLSAAVFFGVPCIYWSVVAWHRIFTRKG